MRDKSVWERACGLSRTVVESVDFDEVAEAVVVAVRPVARARVGAACVGVARRAMTLVTAVGGGGRWIRVRRKCSLRRSRPGFGAVPMG